MKFEDIPNYYHDKKVTRQVGNGVRQDWYGVDQTEKGALICAECNQAYKSKKVFAIHGEERQVLVYRCECGTYHISITHKPAIDPLR